MVCFIAFSWLNQKKLVDRWVIFSVILDFQNISQCLWWCIYLDFLGVKNKILCPSIYFIAFLSAFITLTDWTQTPKVSALSFPEFYTVIWVTIWTSNIIKARTFVVIVITWLLTIFYFKLGRSVSMLMGYWLDSQDLIPGRSKRFYFSHSVQTVSGVHPAPYHPVGTGQYFPGSKVAYAGCWPLMSI